MPMFQRICLVGAGVITVVVTLIILACHYCGKKKKNNKKLTKELKNGKMNRRVKKCPQKTSSNEFDFS